MLSRILKGAFARTDTEATAPVPALVRDAVPQPAPPVLQHAWQALADDAGVQWEQYPDAPRLEVHALFGPAPRRVLDIGCATGAIGAGIKQAYPGSWVWGCELNLQTAQVAAGRLDALSTDPLEAWDRAQLDELRTVDTVLLLDVLEHMVNPWAHLQFLARHLAADTQVIVSLPNIGFLGVLADLAEGRFQYQAAGILDVTHVRFFTKADMLAMFEQTGFHVQHVAPLSGNRPEPLPGYPWQVSAGKLTVTVDSPEAWEAMNTIQFGFRLVPARPRAAA